jgi:hypothetical protein
MTVWADLRQVVIATDDHHGMSAILRGELRLGAGFGDSELDAFGIADDTMAVGSHAFLELVSPTSADHPMAQFLAARGGTAGYLLSVQVSDVDACIARCGAEGVRITHSQLVHGHRIAQLHPGDMSFGVELDGIPTRGEWFWDSLPVDRPPDARVDDIVAVELAVKDPGAAAARWSVVFGMPVGADGSSIDLGGRVVRFVPRGEASGLSHVLVRAVDRADAGETLMAGPVRFTLV